MHGKGPFRLPYKTKWYQLYDIMWLTKAKSQSHSHYCASIHIRLIHWTICQNSIKFIILLFPNLVWTNWVSHNNENVRHTVQTPDKSIWLIFWWKNYHVIDITWYCIARQSKRALNDSLKLDFMANKKKNKNYCTILIKHDSFYIYSTVFPLSLMWTQLKLRSVQSNRGGMARAAVP